MGRKFKNPPIFRIIGGKWRGRKLPFIVADGLRPTGDRTREMLFNWIQWEISGSRCLDLFAGSGALGFEAASRGATDVVMVEISSAAAQQLRENCGMLGADNIAVVEGSAFRYAQVESAPFDLIFVDPPFADDLVESICCELERSSLMHDATLIYVESPRAHPPLVSNRWRVRKSRRIAQVTATLFERA